MQEQHKKYFVYDIERRKLTCAYSHDEKEEKLGHIYPCLVDEEQYFDWVDARVLELEERGL